ncbi:MAG TPA: S24 family peptidase [Dongiaceae bacterium]|nr:S24 family peptidase [Dongiaceae bacterium]
MPKKTVDIIEQKRRAALQAFFDARPRKMNGICKKAGVAAATVRDFLACRTHSMVMATYDKIAKSEGIPVQLLLGEEVPQDRLAEGPLRRLIADRAEAIGYKLEFLSKKLGRPETYLGEFINNSPSIVLHEDERDKLANLLGLTPSDLRNMDEGEADILERSSPKSNIFHNLMRSAEFDLSLGREGDMGNADLPVFGSVKGSFDGSEIDYQNPVMYIERPARLRGVSDAAGLLVSFESMLPRFQPGETVILDPRLPARAGDDVVVELQEHMAIVKKFVRKTDTYVELRQLNPEKTVKLERSKVVGIYRITDLKMT